MWHLWAITIRFSYKAGQQRKLLYWRSQHEFAGCVEGRQEGRMVGRGWMAAEEVYSCLQARPYLSRLLLWRWPSCHHAANTKQLHMRVSWAALFVSHPVCQLFTLCPCLLLFSVWFNVYSLNSLFINHQTTIYFEVYTFNQFSLIGFTGLRYKTHKYSRTSMITTAFTVDTVNR